MKNIDPIQSSPTTETATDWEARYQENSTRWERGEINTALLHWLADGFLPAGRVLIPGCGRSPEPFLLAEQGFDVTGVDFAPSAIAHQIKARKSHPNADQLQFEQADIMQWEASAPFDAIYDQTCLCALNPNQLPAYADQLHNWLRPGGMLLVLFMQTDKQGGPPFHCEIADMQAIFTPDKWQWNNGEEFISQHNNEKFERGKVLLKR